MEDMNTKRTALSALTVLALFGVASCGSDDDPNVIPAEENVVEDNAADNGGDTGADAPAEDTDDTGADGEAEDTGSETLAEGTGDDAGADDLDVLWAAISTAEEDAGGTAYEVDDQDDDGTWEIDVAVGDRSIEVTVTSDGAEVVGTDDDDDLDDDDRRALDAATITIQDAITTALNEVPGTFDDAELDEEDGSFHWEISIDATDGDDDVEVYVDVESGDVVRVDS